MIKIAADDSQQTDELEKKNENVEIEDSNSSIETILYDRFRWINLNLLSRIKHS